VPAKAVFTPTTLLMPAFLSSGEVGILEEEFFLSNPKNCSTFTPNLKVNKLMNNKKKRTNFNGKAIKDLLMLFSETTDFINALSIKRLNL
jgi:hypothetical protein